MLCPRLIALAGVAEDLRDFVQVGVVDEEPLDGAPAGICLLSESRAELGEGFVGVLGVLKDFRGRGLAQLLLRRAFVHYRERGRTAIALGVDATNTTGAVALYEKVGMSPALVFEVYEHDLG